MSSMMRFAKVSSLSLALAVFAGCGSDDGGSNFDTPPDTEAGTDTGGSSGGGGTSGGGRGSGGAGTSGGGTGSGTGGIGAADSGTGGAVNAGGNDAGGTANGGTDGGSAGGLDGGSAGGATPSDGGSPNAGGAGGAGTGGQGAGGAPPLKPNGDPCANGNECTSGNCVGSACCAVACDTPGTCEQLQGTVCVSGTTCRYGLQPQDTPCDDGDVCTVGETCFNRACQDGTPKDCSDATACTDDTCQAGTGTCVHTAVDCNDNNPCTTDTCNVTLGCRNANNTAVCDDGNPCTTPDRCSAGQCSGPPRDCGGLTTDCRRGVCQASTGNCVTQAIRNGQTCDDGLDACDATGICSARNCVGQSDACGALATSCATCTSGVQCFAGRDCTCGGGAGVIETNGTCVVNTDQCATNPCGANATCLDPTPNGSVTETANALCTCLPSFTGNGVTDCTCAAGLQLINPPSGPECVCDLDGTYVLTTTSYLQWPAVAFALEASPPAGVPSYSWALRYHTTNPDGSLTVQTIPCGGTSPTLCIPPPLGGIAAAQFSPTQYLGRPGMVCPTPSVCTDGVPTMNFPLSGIRPGGDYVEPEVAAVLGIQLTDPAGQWPPSRTSTINGATFIDSDNDGALGVTTMAVTPGGTVIDGTLDPPMNYGPSVCPRLSGGARWGYQAVPGLAAGIFYTYQWSGATRITGALSSTQGTVGNSIAIQSGACVIAGDLIGPDPGNKPHADARMYGCQTCNLSGGTCTPDNACTPGEVNFYDNPTNQVQTVGAATFRIATTTIDMAAILAENDLAARDPLIVQACAEVRQQNCPVGETCVAP